MSITLLGALFLPLCLFFWRTALRLMDLLFVGSVFNAGAVMVLGGFGLPPNLVPSVLLVLFVGLKLVSGVRYPAERTVLHSLLPFTLFCVWAFASSFLMPRIFEGRILVWPEKASEYYDITPLAPSFGNVTQDLYLFVAFALVMAASIYLTRSGLPLRRILNAYFLSGFLVIGIAIWQLFSNSFGLWFPTDFLFSNPGWSVLTNQSIDGSYTRLTGPFSEPSSLGAYLAGIAGATGWIILNGHNGFVARALFACSIFVIILSTASTGYVAITLMAAIATIYAIIKGSALMRRRVIIGWAGIAALATILTISVPVLAPGVGRLAVTVMNATLSKNESSSYADRTSTDRDSLNEVVKSDGLGVGWGSNRSSSLAPGVLASSGVAGGVLLLWFFFNVVNHVSKAYRCSASPEQLLVMRAATGGITGGLLSALLSGPSLTSPDFYLLLALLIATAARVRYEAALAPVETPFGALDRVAG